ncbi:hypothetical protein [Burkholderia contaminans]|uniref:hypothetical protein n=1 Tax=Burkholderia contaminans TaxID=488447 RepID=UPI000AC7FAD6|nr:hypothetical protein [Burkholderia contaminans]MEB4652008.1 hypothetical protein [Burkholderia contaminans]MEB4678809.1 hypothetical protein [Burkholderia contaminans]MEB4721636.1 hypothetical protein [Burkholderia contaminans]
MTARAGQCIDRNGEGRNFTGAAETAEWNSKTGGASELFQKNIPGPGDRLVSSMTRSGKGLTEARLKA